MFLKAVELNPQNDFNFMGLGDIYRDEEKYKDAEYMFKRALAMNPKSESYMGLGWLYLRMGKNDEAERAFQEYLEKIKPKGEVYLGLGIVAQNKGELDKAEEMFKKSVELNPTVGGPQALAALYRNRGQTQKADDILKEFHVSNHGSAGRLR